MKNHRYTASIIANCLLFIASCSCSDLDDPVFDENGVAIGLHHLWKSPITNNNELAKEFVVTPIIYDETNVLIGGNSDGEKTILSLNANTGQLNWKWVDAVGLIDNKAYHFNNDLLFFNFNSRSFCIKLTSGTTLWEYESERERPGNNAGIDDIYFSAGSNKRNGFLEPASEENIYFGKMDSSDEEQLLLQPKYTPVDFQTFNGALNSLKAFRKDGKAYLAFGIQNPSAEAAPLQRGRTELNLYNITEGKIVYEKIAIDPDGYTESIADIFYQAPNLYFRSSKFIHSYDAMTGEEVWRTPVGNETLPSGMILADNKLFTMWDGHSLYCIDASTGNLLWELPTAGILSEPSYLSGILYFVSGGDLHAVEGATGKQVWKISSLDLVKDPGAWFQGVCIAVPGVNGEKGVVVATTGLNAYAYEAAR
jgi:outer membrane protein assembly factor BamB